MSINLKLITVLKKILRYYFMSFAYKKNIFVFIRIEINMETKIRDN